MSLIGGLIIIRPAWWKVNIRQLSRRRRDNKEEPAAAVVLLLMVCLEQKTPPNPASIRLRVHRNTKHRLEFCARDWRLCSSVFPQRLCGCSRPAASSSMYPLWPDSHVSRSFRHLVLNRDFSHIQGEDCWPLTLLMFCWTGITSTLSRSTSQQLIGRWWCHAPDECLPPPPPPGPGRQPGSMSSCVLGMKKKTKTKKKEPRAGACFILKYILDKWSGSETLYSCQSTSANESTHLQGCFYIFSPNVGVQWNFLCWDTKKQKPQEKWILTFANHDTDWRIVWVALKKLISCSSSWKCTFYPAQSNLSFLNTDLNKETLNVIDFLLCLFFHFSDTKYYPDKIMEENHLHNSYFTTESYLPFQKTPNHIINHSNILRETIKYWDLSWKRGCLDKHWPLVV